MPNNVIPPIAVRSQADELLEHWKQLVEKTKQEEVDREKREKAAAAAQAVRPQEPQKSEKELEGLSCLLLCSWELVMIFVVVVCLLVFPPTSHS